MQVSKILQVLWRGFGILLVSSISIGLGSHHDTEKSLFRTVNGNQERAPANTVHALAEIQDVFDQLAQIRLDQNLPDEAFEWTERGRARSVLDLWKISSDFGGNTVTAAELDRLVGTTTALLVFSAVGGRMVCWVFHGGSHSFVDLNLSVGEAKSRVSRYQAAISAYSKSPKVAEISKYLYETIFSPLNVDLEGIKKLVVVPSSNLSRLPFSALLDPRSGRYLIEDVAISRVPSATLFHLARQRRTAEALTPTLVIGDPASAMPRLPHANREASTIASLMPNSHLLLGKDATASSVLSLIPAVGSLHFAGHGSYSGEDWTQAALHLTPEPGRDGQLRLQDIFLLFLNEKNLQLRLVSLAACDTIGNYEGEGPPGIAQAFFAIGVPQVVGTLWKVGDQITGEFMIAFYKNLGNHSDATEALRTTILGLETFEDPASWTPFAVLGA